MATATPVERDQLQREQDAFDAALPDLLVEHRGQIVIFKDERPVGFYRSFEEAYAQAIRHFGLDTVFLISKVTVEKPSSSSITWDLAVL
jgi:hypothetical protein